MIPEIVLGNPIPVEVLLAVYLIALFVAIGATAVIYLVLKRVLLA